MELRLKAARKTAQIYRLKRNNSLSNRVSQAFNCDTKTREVGRSKV